MIHSALFSLTATNSGINCTVPYSSLHRGCAAVSCDTPEPAVAFDVLNPLSSTSTSNQRVVLLRLLHSSSDATAYFDCRPHKQRAPVTTLLASFGALVLITPPLEGSFFLLTSDILPAFGRASSPSLSAVMLSYTFCPHLHRAPFFRTAIRLKTLAVTVLAS